MRQFNAEKFTGSFLHWEQPSSTAEREVLIQMRQLLMLNQYLEAWPSWTGWLHTLPPLPLLKLQADCSSKAQKRDIIFFFCSLIFSGRKSTLDNLSQGEKGQTVQEASLFYSIIAQEAQEDNGQTTPKTQMQKKMAVTMYS